MSGPSAAPLVVVAAINFPLSRAEYQFLPLHRYARADNRGPPSLQASVTEAAMEAADGGGAPTAARAVPKRAGCAMGAPPVGSPHPAARPDTASLRLFDGVDWRVGKVTGITIAAQYGKRSGLNPKDRGIHWIGEGVAQQSVRQGGDSNAATPAGCAASGQTTAKAPDNYGAAGPPALRRPMVFPWQSPSPCHCPLHLALSVGR
jgi:hypothetical protein